MKAVFSMFGWKDKIKNKLWKWYHKLQYPPSIPYAVLILGLSAESPRDASWWFVMVYVTKMTGQCIIVWHQCGMVHMHLYTYTYAIQDSVGPQRSDCEYSLFAFVLKWPFSKFSYVQTGGAMHDTGTVKYAAAPATVQQTAPESVVRRVYSAILFL